MSSFKDYHFKQYINEALEKINFKSPTPVRAKEIGRAHV